MPDESVQCCVTSPPYWGLRDYGHPGQIGQEATPDEFVQAMVEVFREVRRVLKKDGTCWINIGDTYNAPVTVYVGVTGDVVVIPYDGDETGAGNSCLFKAVPAGATVPVAVRQVVSANTTATTLVGIIG